MQLLKVKAAWFAESRSAHARRGFDKIVRHAKSCRASFGFNGLQIFQGGYSESF